jgi:hypothetical protein
VSAFLLKIAFESEEHHQQGAGNDDVGFVHGEGITGEFACAVRSASQPAGMTSVRGFGGSGAFDGFEFFQELVKRVSVGVGLLHVSVEKCLLVLQLALALFAARDGRLNGVDLQAKTIELRAEFACSLACFGASSFEIEPRLLLDGLDSFLFLPLAFALSKSDGGLGVSGRTRGFLPRTFFLFGEVGDALNLRQPFSVTHRVFPIKTAEEKQTCERSQRVDLVHGVGCFFEEKDDRTFNFLELIVHIGHPRNPRTDTNSRRAPSELPVACVREGGTLRPTVLCTGVGLRC